MKEWALQAADLDAKVTDEFSSDKAALRVIISADSAVVWALKFPSELLLERFVAEYNGKLFENIYGKENKPENITKVYALLCCAVLVRIALVSYHVAEEAAELVCQSAVSHQTWSR